MASERSPEQAYDAFLSYSHADVGVAAALQRGLHRVGRRLGQLRALRVYRDATDLAANPGFWAKLVEAINASRYLVVVLSPAAASSEWVNKEVETWIDQRGSSEVLIALAQGTLHWDAALNRFDPELSNAAPPALTMPGVFEAEPLFVDLSDFEEADLSDIRQGPFRSKVIDLAAPIHGKPKEVFDSEDRRELRRFRRYRRAAIAGLVVLTVASVVTSFIAVGQRNEARQQTANARARELAALSISEDDPDRALALAVEAEFATSPPVNQARTAFAAAVQRYLQLPATAAGPAWRNHGANVEGVAWSADGSRVASAGADGRIVVWGALTGSAELEFPLDGASDVSYLSVDWSPDGAMIAAGDDTGAVTVFGSDDGEVVSSFSIGAVEADSVKWSSDGDSIAVGDRAGSVVLLALLSGRETSLVIGTQEDGSYKHDLAWSPDGRRLLSAGVDKEKALVLDAAGAEEPVELASEVGSIRAVDWSPDGDMVAVGGSGGLVETFAPGSGEFLASLNLQGDWIDAVSFSPDGSIIASGGHDSQLRLFDVDSGDQIGGSLTSHSGWVSDIAWNGSGSQLATASTDRTVRLWDTDGSSGPIELLGHDDEVLDIAWSASGDRLVSSSSDTTAILWDMDALEPLLHLQGDVGVLGATAWSPDDAQIITGGDDGVLLIWDATSGRLLRTIDAHDDWILAVGWSSDGGLVASASVDGTLAVFDAANGDERGFVDGDVALNSLSWSPQDNRLAFGGEEGSVGIWDAATDTVQQEFRPEGGQPIIHSIAWSPRGRFIAAGYSDSIIRIWEVDGEPGPYRTLVGHDAGVLAVAWSPTDDLLVSGSEDASVRLWNVPAGRQVGTPLTYPEWKADVLAVAWSPQGDRVVSAFNTSGIQVWEGLTETASCELALKALGEAAARALADDIPGAPLCLDPAAVTDLPLLPVAPLR